MEDQHVRKGGLAKRRVSLLTATMFATKRVLRDIHGRRNMCRTRVDNVRGRQELSVDEVNAS